MKARKRKEGARDKVEKDGVSVDNLDAELARAMSDLAAIKEYYQNGGSVEERVKTPAKHSEKKEKPEQKKDNQTDSSDKLTVAEAVIRKLYKRNIELETTLKDLKHHTQTNQEDKTVKREKPMKEGQEKSKQEATSSQTNQKEIVTSSSESEASKPPERPKEERRHGEESSTLPVLDRKGEEHLLLMLETRDRTIAELEATVAELKERLDDVEGDKGQTKKQRRRQKEIEADLKEANARVQHYIQQIEAMRTSQSMRLATSNDGKKMFTLLTEQLDAQFREHEREREYFNSKLGSLEEENRELFVQNKMFQTQLRQVSQELKQRDSIEAEIQRQVYGIFTHMKKLEAENHRYKAQLLNH